MSLKAQLNIESSLQYCNMNPYKSKRIKPFCKDRFANPNLQVVDHKSKQIHGVGFTNPDSSLEFVGFSII
jgi:hypothetical protein